ncbi:MAG: protein kinase, partial [Victivallales bacterium]|nr:protein kinase [Victivallales bacterium]
MPDNETYLYGLRVLSRCGSGAYGDVYYCQDASGKRVALKVISKDKIGSGWERELKGITNYRRLTEDSPLLLNIFHVGEDESNFYYTMEPADAVAGAEEYIPDTLARRLTSGALPEDILMPVLKDILSAIRLLHEAGFTHRDIKPENILFINGKLKLADMGLLSPLSGTLSQLAGTLDFMPPEQRTREPSPDTRDSRQRNDLYAFGKIIYCCITGNGADQFPSLPTNIPLTLQNKLFFRLALRLCDKEPGRRLAQLPDVVAAFDDTVRMCLYGETLSDKLHYACSTLYRNFSCTCSHLLKSMVRHWLLSLLCLATIGICAWYVWPSPPYDITKEQTKTYRHEDLGIEMKIPMEWEILSSKTANEWLKEANDEEKNLSEQEKKRMEFFASLLELGCDYIICDYDESNPDNITIQTVPVPGKMLIETSDDDLRVGMQQLFKGELGFDTKIYDFKRLTLAGHSCIFIDLSHAPGSRVNNYMFPLKDKCFAIALTARQETFFERRAQFQS